MTKIDAQALIEVVLRWRRDYANAIVHCSHASDIAARILAAEHDLQAWFEPYGIELDIGRLPHRRPPAEAAADLAALET